MTNSSPTSPADDTRTDHAGDPRHPVPLHVDTGRVILAGLLCWVVALVVILVVPGLHQGERSWWVWVPVIGITLGLLGYAYVRRGRGNAAAA